MDLGLANRGNLVTRKTGHVTPLCHTQLCMARNDPETNKDNRRRWTTVNLRRLGITESPAKYMSCGFAAISDDDDDC